jgi:hypothetical protein
MKKFALAALAALVVGSANARDPSLSLPTITPQQAAVFNPANTLANPIINSFRSELTLITNNLNQGAAYLGVSTADQVQWTGQFGLGKAFGALYESIDLSASPIAPALTFDDASWTVTGKAPISIDTIKENAQNLSYNIADQVGHTTGLMGGVIGTQVAAYNLLYATPGVTTSNTDAERQQDYNTVTTYASNTKAAVDAARNYDGYARFYEFAGGTLETLDNLIPLRSTNVSYSADGSLTYTGNTYSSYTDFVLSTPRDGVYIPN